MSDDDDFGRRPPHLPRVVDRRRAPALLRQAAEGIGIVTAASLLLLAFGWLVAFLVAWIA